MAKISFTNLKLKINNSTKELKIGDNTIDVLQYLPAEDKYDLIVATLQKAKRDGIYDPFFVEIFFNLNLIYLYTNISFTEKQREDELKLYNLLESNNIINQVIENIPENEYQNLVDSLNDEIEAEMNFATSAGGFLNKFIGELPVALQNAQSIVDNFDKDKYQQVIDFAKAANGGRNIK